MKRQTWLIDGGVRRFLLAAGIFLLIAGTLVTFAVSQKFSKFSDSVAARSSAGSASSAPVALGDHEDDASRPDALAAARDGLSRWLKGDPGALTPAAALAAPVAPVGAALVDGGEVLVPGDSYCAVRVPMIAENVEVSAVVEMTYDNGWQITNFVVS